MDHFQQDPPYRLDRNPERTELRRNSSIAACGVLMVYAVTYGVIFALYFLAGRFFPKDALSEHWGILYDCISLAAYIASFLIASLVMVRWIRIPKHIAFPMQPANPVIVTAGVFFCLGASVVGGYLYQFVSAVTESLFQVKPIMPDLTPPAGGAQLVIYFINVVLAPAFLEEMMFRGVILQSLRRFGDGFALVMSSILFAMAHGNLVQGPNTLVVGLAIGFFVLRTGSLWTGIVIHFVNNALAVCIDLGLRYAESTPWVEQMLNGGYFLLYFVGAAAALLYLLTLRPRFFQLAPYRSASSNGTRAVWFFTTVMQIILLAVTAFVTSRYFQPLA